MICAVTISRANDSKKDINEAAYRVAVEAIMDNDFALKAWPESQEVFILLSEGEWGHFQPAPYGDPYVVSGKASDIKTQIKKNGTVIQSMRITSERSGVNTMIVNITMKKGTNKATATVTLDKERNPYIFTMRGNIVPAEGSGVHPKFEGSGVTQFQNPLATF